jgi:hypothetical protein
MTGTAPPPRTVMAAHLMGPAAPRKGLDRHVIVKDPDVGPVSVRWYLGRAEPWRCRECGLLAEASCPHTFSAALLLAETLLGLTRAPELRVCARDSTPTQDTFSHSKPLS